MLPTIGKSTKVLTPLATVITESNLPIESLTGVKFSFSHHKCRIIVLIYLLYDVFLKNFCQI